MPQARHDEIEEGKCNHIPPGVVDMVAAGVVTRVEDVGKLLIKVLEDADDIAELEVLKVDDAEVDVLEVDVELEVLDELGTTGVGLSETGDGVATGETRTSEETGTDEAEERLEDSEGVIPGLTAVGAGAIAEVEVIPTAAALPATTALMMLGSRRGRGYGKPEISNCLSGGRREGLICL